MGLKSICGVLGKLFSCYDLNKPLTSCIPFRNYYNQLHLYGTLPQTGRLPCGD